tara:strand:- start:62 stop:316 length:255 start_codon:yes stop_codon:yes gene_type:complete
VEEFADEAAKLHRLAEESGRPRPQIQCSSEILTRIPFGQLEEIGVTRLMMGVGGFRDPENTEIQDADIPVYMEQLREHRDKLAG